MINNLRTAGLRLLACCACLGLIPLCGFAQGKGLSLRGVTITVAPGMAWSSIMWFGPIPIRKYPQAAAWIETASGEYVATISVSASAARNSWKASPQGGRPEALPIWNAARGSGKADAVSSATQKQGGSITWGSDDLVIGREYRIRFEINTSFDYNETWPKKAKQGAVNYSGVNGQPSVLYEGRFTAGKGGAVALMPIGQGSIDGSTGQVLYDLRGLTTALDLVDSVTAEIVEGGL